MSRRAASITTSFCLAAFLALGVWWAASYFNMSFGSVRGTLYLYWQGGDQPQFFTSDQGIEPRVATIKNMLFTGPTGLTSWGNVDRSHFEHVGFEYAFAESGSLIGRSLLWPAAAVLIAVLWFGMIYRRQVRRQRLGLCRKCGYDLRESAGRCPECGAEQSTGRANGREA